MRKGRAHSRIFTKRSGDPMRIPCPFCGERDLSEFAYLGAADIARPDPSVPGALEKFVDAVYLRDNPAGPLAELWYHGSGCRSWLRVTRNTRSHEILACILRRNDEAEMSETFSGPDGQPNRLPGTGLIDRERSVSFQFDGREYAGFMRRHARIGSSREWRPNCRTLVQVSSTSRYHDGRFGRAQCARGAANRRPS